MNEENDEIKPGIVAQVQDCIHPSDVDKINVVKWIINAKPN